MAYGIELYDENGKSWIDVVQPTWMWDVRSNITGSGTLTYAFDTSLFKLKVVVVADVTLDGYVSEATFYVSGNSITYYAPRANTFIVFLEAL